MNDNLSGDVLTPEGDPLFSFDGAEGIAFWVNDEKRDVSVRVMVAEVPSLRAFLDYWFPQHDERYDEASSDMTWKQLIFSYSIKIGPIEKGWVTYRGGPRHAVRDGLGRIWFELWTGPGSRAGANVAATFEADGA